MILTGSNLAAALIKAFGSVKAAAAAIGCSERTVRRWRDRVSQPQHRHVSKAKSVIAARASDATSLAETMRPTVSR